MPATALITGVTGFIGSHVARRMAAGGWQVAGLARRALESGQTGHLCRYSRIDLCSLEIGAFVRSVHPRVCIHCAGPGEVAKSFSAPSDDFRASVDGTFNLLEALRNHAPDCRFLYVSSAAVYGDPETLPIGEDARCRPRSPYGFHKFLGEQLCREFAEIYGLRTAIARVFSAYGPGLRRQVIWEMCNKALRERVLVLRGLGSESRDFLHVADVAAAIETLADQSAWCGEAYNVASGFETRIDDLADLVVRLANPGMQVQFDGVAMPGYPRNWRADISRLRAFGFRPSITLEDGIGDVVRWCVQESAQHRMFSTNL